MNLDKLIELCDKYTVEVSFNGIAPFTHNVIDAEPFLEEIHTTSNIDKDEFVSNINNGNFMTDEYNQIFHNITQYGIFKIRGHENVTGIAYIETEKLEFLNIKQN